MNKIDKLEIADEFLNQAIEIYLHRHSYLAALHLAGAAQEIYGKWLRCSKKEDFSTIMLNQLEANSNNLKVNRKELKKADKYAKNTIKHLENEADRYIHLNPKFDALVMITEAFTEYLMLERQETDNIKKFKSYLVESQKKEL